ncbi:hypothetical protein P22_0066 [Propionispora sp. 2/2-37]|uniref:2-oxoacid:acceptor oxidoreductase family protein n=1 Tax=Propionispora sp. 2/2-37 TaxID=1677858 RepID=UPI0006BB839E|nr:2-oxoacid:acceptor oxidoreductase family protein [Propionispora sp. 2/2-37]CUH94004.1 hypothetical protein P22_0066 [Propionispora sp. 2/2-37]
MLEITLGGTGGQGLILAGIILAEAAILDGKQVVQTQSYGPEARGGASKADVIISNHGIDYPKVLAPDILLVMSQEACDKYACLLKSGGKLLLDTTFVKKTMPELEAEFIELAITQAARKEFGNPVFANIIALGALVEATGIVSEASLRAAVLARVPKGTEEKNQAALALGKTLYKNN